MAPTKDAKTFGVALLGDCATRKHKPLLIMLWLCREEPPVVIAILTVVTTCEKVGRKMLHILGIYSRKNVEFDHLTTCTDVFLFDGPWNAHEAGGILCTKYPWTFCFHGGKHVWLLFFSDLANLKPIKKDNYFLTFPISLEFYQTLILNTCRLYNRFRSGASHKIHSQFMTQTTAWKRKKGFDCFKEQDLGLQPGFMPWIFLWDRSRHFVLLFTD